jgi:hypothetical protein
LAVEKTSRGPCRDINDSELIDTISSLTFDFIPARNRLFIYYLMAFVAMFLSLFSFIVVAVDKEKMMQTEKVFSGKEKMVF